MQDTEWVCQHDHLGYERRCYGNLLQSFRANVLENIDKAAIRVVHMPQASFYGPVVVLPSVGT